jgi:hypothetical protein
MGRASDPMAVVDSRARVRGVTRLRVVDASAFPFVPPGQPMSSVCKHYPFSDSAPPLTAWLADESELHRHVCREDRSLHPQRKLIATYSGRSAVSWLEYGKAENTV